MRILLTLLALLFFSSARSQVERDTVLKRCPVYITDTVTSNNFFIEARPATLKVYRVKGKLTIAVEQRDQFFTLFFHDRKLRSGKYDISPGSRGGREVEATYSFKTGDQASYIVLSKGSVDVSFDKEKNMWLLKVYGLIANMVERSVTYYRVKADLFVL